MYKICQYQESEGLLYLQILKIFKRLKGWLYAILSQWICKWRWNGHITSKTQTAKAHSEKNTDNLNSSITIKVIEFVFLSIPGNKIPNSNGFTGELYSLKYLRNHWKFILCHQKHNPCKLEFITIKSVCFLKVKRMRKTGHRLWENILKIIYQIKIVSQIYKELSKFHNKKIKNPVHKQ